MNPLNRDAGKRVAEGAAASPAEKVLQLEDQI